MAKQPQPDQITAKSWGEWRKIREDGLEFILPYSELPARLRPVEVADLLLSTGEIDDVLTPLAMGSLFKDGIDTDKIFSSLELTRAYFAIANKVCRLAFVSPRIVDEITGDDEILLEDLDTNDRNYVFNVAMGSTNNLIRFHQEQTRSMESVSDGD